MDSYCDIQYIYLFFQVTDLTKEDIIEQFKAELELLDQIEAADNIVEPPQKKTKKMKSFLDDEDDDDDESLGKRSVSLQLESYLKEVPIKSKSCPGDWWRLNETKYPEIGKLARKYLAIQGTSTPAERVMSDMGLILNKKRLAMTDEHFRMLMYLGDAKQ